MSGSNGVKSVNLQEAIENLQNHTLEGISGEIARLIYLASTRDYNTGEYHHEGLAYRFNEEIACTALALRHQEIFRKLVFSSLEELVEELNVYMNSARVSSAEFLEVWKKLEPYRVTVPLDCDALSVELFLSNIRVALAILENRRSMPPHS